MPQPLDVRHLGALLGSLAVFGHGSASNLVRADGCARIFRIRSLADWRFVFEMKAVVFHRPGHVEVNQVPDPKIEHEEDAIVRVTSTAICGSDLHIFNGFIPQKNDMVMGHEFMGIVEETGRGVTKVQKGDRVVVPFPIACGHCFFCGDGLPGHCENSNPEKYGPEGGLVDQKGGGLFGYTDLYGGYDGGQAEYVRVPYANFGPRKVPDRFQDEEVLFLTDIFPTGWSAIDWANLKGGETVAVFGCGPVGLMAQKIAWLRGAKRVIGVDIQPYRLEMARRAANSEVINAADGNAVESIRAVTQGRGADVCVDAVGLEADRKMLEKLSNIVHLQAGSINALKLCISAVRRGGVVTVVGVYGMPYDAFPLGQIFDKGITMRFGQAPVQKYIDELIGIVERGEIKLDDIITHRLPLAEAPHAYQIFRDKEDNCVKVVLKP
jgi:alcohol dehydrogenase